MIPRTNIINTINSFPLPENSDCFLFLYFRHHRRPHKRWVAHDVVEGGFGDDGFPVQAEGVALGDVGVGFQGQEVQAHADDIFGLFHHLALCDPEGSFGNGGGEVVDLDTVELVNGDFDRVEHLHDDLIFVE